MKRFFSLCIAFLLLSSISFGQGYLQQFGFGSTAQVVNLSEVRYAEAGPDGKAVYYWVNNSNSLNTGVSIGVAVDGSSGVLKMLEAYNPSQRLATIAINPYHVTSVRRNANGKADILLKNMQYPFISLEIYEDVVAMLTVPPGGGSSGGGGGGGVSSFSATGLSPLFNTTVTSSTSTPVLSFSPITVPQNTFYGGSDGGGVSNPSFRAILASDIPGLPASKITTGVLPFANGGTGASTIGTAGQLARVNGAGTGLEYFTHGFLSGNLTGDVTSVGTATTIPNASVTLAKIQNISGFAILGRNATGSGSLSAITATAGTHNNLPLVFSGTGFGFTQLNTAAFADNTIALSKLSVSGATDGQVPKWSTASNAWVAGNDVGGGTGDNWGSQVAATDMSIMGNGVSGNAIKLVGDLTTPGNSKFYSTNGSGVRGWYDLPAFGTVTSVGLSVPAIFTVTGSPVTTSGDLALGLSTQVANRVFAGPASGGATTPTFRDLVANDIPPLPATKITTGTLATARGGTGMSTVGAANTLMYSDGTNLAYSKLLLAMIAQNGATDGQILKWSTASNAWVVGNDLTGGGGGGDNFVTANLTATVARTHTMLDNSASSLVLTSAGGGNIFKMSTLDAKEGIEVKNLGLQSINNTITNSPTVIRLTTGATPFLFDAAEVGTVKIIENNHTNTVAVTPNSPATINGAASYTLYGGESVMIRMETSTTWEILSSYINPVIQANGANLARPKTINFTGAGVTATNSSGNITVNIPGGGGGGGSSTTWVTIASDYATTVESPLTAPLYQAVPLFVTPSLAIGTYEIECMMSTIPSAAGVGMSVGFVVTAGTSGDGVASGTVMQFTNGTTASVIAPMVGAASYGPSPIFTTVPSGGSPAIYKLTLKVTAPCTWRPNIACEDSTTGLQTQTIVAAGSYIKITQII
jgi:hypothetical protein